MSSLFADYGQMGGMVPRRTQRPRFRPGEDGLCQAVPCSWNDNQHPDHNESVAARVNKDCTPVHQDGAKYATGLLSRFGERDNIDIGTWNTRTQRVAGNLQDLTHEVYRY